MNMPLRLLPALTLAAASLAHASDAQPCGDDALVAVARWAGIDGQRVAARETNGLVAASACKVTPDAPDAPDAPGTMIAAVAFDSLPRSKHPDESNKLQVVALVENGKVVAAERSVVEEDAATEIDANSYRIDTAPYRLSPDVRAFGVVFTSSARGPSCPDANASEELTLWVRDGNHLRPVFGTNLAGWVNTDIKHAICSPGASDDAIVSANMTIGVERTSSHGFADLSITAHVEPPSRKDKRTIRTIVRYDGKSYGIDMFRNFWYPSSAMK
ncbi:hypothetical protein [Burkholderia stagnalis]|uniref:hypothetical protein n=1 Tax=Burkholderia stagnalis TaxID=1503054 RepID=UPI00075921C0|nr:hypothetical protein [Burkholderia stagnalis]KWH41198.1 multidrug ABC transporter ATPase [Burkholderia stagnalis]KWH48255.1 multidrug ABC transporter ATPase [Burkholderia stagnalis]